MHEIRIDQIRIGSPRADRARVRNTIAGEKLAWSVVCGVTAFHGCLVILLSVGTPAFQLIGLGLVLGACAVAVVFLGIPRFVNSCVASALFGIDDLQGFLGRIMDEAGRKQWERMVNQTRERELALAEQRIAAERAEAERQADERRRAERDSESRVENERRERELVKRRRLELEEAERRREKLARQEWEAWHAQPLMDEIDRMSGRQFEEFLIRLLCKMGYTDVSSTPNNDFGSDIIATDPEGFFVAIQAKRWKGRVGVSAVQECNAGVDFYQCDGGMLVTNAWFTKQARVLAEGLDRRIDLCDRNWLERSIAEYIDEMPAFSWDEYHALAAALGRSTRQRARNGPSDLNYYKAA